MPIERVGYRRLYDSMGCSLSNQEELNFNMKIGNIEAILYMGSKPKRGIVVYSNVGKYIAPGEISPMGNMEYQKDASLSTYPRKFFTEVQCIKQIEGHELPLGILDITLYRDDLTLISHQPVELESSLKSFTDCS